MPVVDDGSGPGEHHPDEQEIPDFQIAMLAASARILIEEFDIDFERAAAVAIRIDTEQKEALIEFGPELTLTAAEVLWRNET